MTETFEQDLYDFIERYINEENVYEIIELLENKVRCMRDEHGGMK